MRARVRASMRGMGERQKDLTPAQKICTWQTILSLYLSLSLCPQFHVAISISKAHQLPKATCDAVEKERERQTVNEKER